MELSEHDRRIDRVKKAIEDDQTGLTPVLLGVAYAEFYLEQLVRTRMPAEKAAIFFPENRVEHPVEFMTVLRLADALDLLPDGYRKFLSELARLRNRFAHNIDYVATSDDVRAVFNALIAKFKPETAATMRKVAAVVRGSVPDLLSMILNDMVNTLDLLRAEHGDPERLKVLKQREEEWWAEFERSIGAPDK